MRRWFALLIAPLFSACIQDSTLPPGDWIFFPDELVFNTTVGLTSSKFFTIKNNRSDFLEVQIGSPTPVGGCPEQPFLPPPRRTRVAPGTFQQIRIEHAPLILPPTGSCELLLQLWNVEEEETGKRALRLNSGVIDVDSDEDGWGRGEGDCDDLDPDINPGQQEACNGLDDDCDGLIDDEDNNELEKWDPGTEPEPLIAGRTTFYRDSDGDDFAKEGTALLSCGLPPGYILPPTPGNGLPNGGWDCNDQLLDIFPGATEIAGEGIDRNCDGSVTCFLDFDGDGDGDQTPGTAVPHALADPFCQNLIPNSAGAVSRNNEDCDDSHALINKNVLETCYFIDDNSDGDGIDESGPGVDENCNGFIDDADPDLTDPSIWFYDADGDGFGQTNIIEQRCDHSPPLGYVDDPRDCNDGNDRIFPGAEERCNGGIDDDCDGLADDLDPERFDPTQFDQSTFRAWWVDADGDGYGDRDADLSSTTDYQLSCTLPLGFSPNPDDCNDSNATVNPGAPEVPGDLQDQDCDGNEQCYVDADNDTFGSSVLIETVDITCGSPGLSRRPGDCYDDPDPRFIYGSDGVTVVATLPGGEVTYPGNLETCDGVDNDCDTRVDDADDSVSAEDIYYRDADGDGFGDPGFPRIACQPPLGFVIVDVEDGDLFDCNDTTASIKPGGNETVADGVDQDCDGTELCYVDADEDGYGDATATALSDDLRCVAVGVSALRTDCDDDNAPTINPGVVERCDPLNVDEDCDGLRDDEDNDAVGRTLWFADADGDSYGAALNGVFACDRPLNYVENSGDCNDRNGGINPDATEICNTVDDDCDSLVDDADNSLELDFPSAPAPSWYTDDDNDGYGAIGSPTRRCSQPLGSVPTTGDCRDDRPDINPGAVEGIADGVDQDCDGFESCYRDDDNDGWGTAELVDVATTTTCQAAGEAVARGDCDDTRGTVSPDAIEICDGLDNDCDNLIDDADEQVQPGNTPEVTWLRDADADSYGDLGSVTFACTRPSGYVGRLNNMANPASGDRETDCVDNNASINPSAIERPADRVDQNCDGLETCYEDLDDDGFGSTAVTTATADLDCLDANRSLNRQDCDDSEELINPNGTEVCDPLDDDEDCDGLVDDGDGSVFGGLFWYRDGDGDGEGNVDISVVRCEAPADFVDNADDCNDNNGGINTAATEVCDALNLDEDCDGLPDDLDPNVDPTTRSSFFPDVDGDSAGADNAAPRQACDPGLAEATNNLDCDDRNPNVGPGQPEGIADGVDSNCDGDEVCYCNKDGDDVGISSETVLVSGTSCAPPVPTPGTAATTCATGYAAAIAGDCDDTRADVGLDETAWFRDGDRDTFGNPLIFIVACQPPDPATWVQDATDCDDGNAAIRPTATEVCDPANRDEDCNGLADDIDSGVDPTTYNSFFIDGDGDGYGDVPREACDATFGLTTRSGDCNDADPNIHTAAIEQVADGIDSDCDGQELCFCDKDGDGVGVSNDLISTTRIDCAYQGSTPATPFDDCDAPSVPFADAFGDCNDANAAVVSGATLWFFDQDGDGFGNDAVFLVTCEPPAVTAPAQWVLGAGDCSDTDAATNPGGVEICDNADNNCNGVIDEGVSGDYFPDSDGDGFGDQNAPAAGTSCTPPTGFVTDHTDCDDSRSNVNPSRSEVAGNSLDEDCSGDWDCYQDLDNDDFGSAIVVTSPNVSCGNTGEAPNNTDCDDSEATANPNGTEITGNNIDEDCSGTWACFRDNDGDSYGRSVVVQSPNSSCTNPGEADNDNDCNDVAANGGTSINPGATEINANDVDENCDSQWLCFTDGDGDDFGDTATSLVGSSCSTGNNGGSTNNTDCLDSDEFTYPGATESCDGVDQDCDPATAVDLGATDCRVESTLFHSSTNETYLLMDIDQSLADASDACTTLAGSPRNYRMVWLEDATEAAEVITAAESAFGSGTDFWLGVRRGIDGCADTAWFWYDDLAGSGACTDATALSPPGALPAVSADPARDTLKAKAITPPEQWRDERASQTKVTVCEVP